MRYLITHEPHCACRDRAPQPCETIADVGCYLWGRDVLDHVVYDGECPYRFTTGDCESILLTLACYPVERVRHLLPLRLSLRALHARGLCLWRQDYGQIVCEIGDRRKEAP